jgi:AcrR family transcriptional regulator
MATRRDLQRAETVRQIRAATLQQIEQDGAAALSLRKVARQIGMSPAGIYRYYDSRDALLTDLIADAYDDLADAVTEGAGSPRLVTQRLVGSAQGYRRWSLDNPNRFSLIFGTPVPGYVAPEQGPTADAARRVGLAWGDLFRAGVSEGCLDVESWHGEMLPGGLELIEQSPEITAAGIRAVNAWWALVHGLVSVEIQRHFTWAVPDPGEFFVAELNRWLVQVRVDGS